MASLNQTSVDDVTVIKLRGSLTGEGVDQIEAPFEAITNRPGARVVVDLSDVDILTSPALSMFIAAAQTVKQSGGRLIFAHSGPSVSDVLHRLHLQSVLSVAPEVGAAISQAKGECQTKH